jgi:hypothetical protein
MPSPPPLGMHLSHRCHRRVPRLSRGRPSPLGAASLSLSSVHRRRYHRVVLTGDVTAAADGPCSQGGSRAEGSHPWGGLLVLPRLNHRGGRAAYPAAPLPNGGACLYMRAKGNKLRSQTSDSSHIWYFDPDYCVNLGI